ncbi:MAG TPA: CAP domain-containing protein, partial [Tepidisphaeraceae bacterium]|nr:CAP domain-containing protein [Tepidisphaeraceae bacterium]
MQIRRLSAALGILLPGALVSAALPTNDEQYFLEITNRMRLNPQAELRILTNINYSTPTPTWNNPKSSEPNVDDALQYFNVDAATLVNQWNALVAAPPIAWNPNLGDSALFHTNYLISYALAHPTEEAQQHELPGEPTFIQRLQNANYQYTMAAENLYAYAYNAFHGHAGFAIDWGNGPGGIQSPAGHRDNIMNAGYRETGIAIVPENEPTTSIGPLVITMDFGRRSGNAFLTGVVYNDLFTPDHFYTPGEGLDAMTVTVYNAGTSTVRATTTTWSSGGYVLQLANGTYDVKLSGGGLASDILYSNVVMNSTNVKIDSETHWLPASGGNWTTAANWNAGVPNGIGTRAFLTSYLSTGGTITVNTPITVGSIDFDSNGAFTLSGTGSVKLDVSAGQARINAVGFNHSIATPVILNDGTTINISGDLALTGGLQNPLGKTITRSGSGTLHIAGPQAHAPNSLLAITSGTVRAQSDAGTSASAGSAASANLAIDVHGI